ncbi:MAG: hypothetical protein IPO91_08775 [Chloroflexi bacterium]|nr:hypothetical protein [Chloroflexota bacterium]
MMVSPLRWGCLLWIMIFSAVAAAFYATTLKEQGSTDTAAPYFALENDTILYDAVSTLDNCNYIIVGTVHTLDGTPFTDFIVNIHMVLDEVEPPPDSFASPEFWTARPDDPSDPSNWGFFLVNWQIPYEIWLTDLRGGTVLSDRIYVLERDCDQNRATLNFVQIR